MCFCTPLIPISENSSDEAAPASQVPARSAVGPVRRVQEELRGAARAGVRGAAAAPAGEGEHAGEVLCSGMARTNHSLSNMTNFIDV